MSESRLYLREEGSGAPLLLVHGWSCHGGFFTPQIEAFSRRYHVLVPDLPGHGRTGDGLPLTIEAAADAVADLLEERDLSGVTICGWSMGAHVAYAYAQCHGTERLRSIAAIDMSPKVLNTPDWGLGSRGGLDAARNIHVLAAMVREWPQLAPRIAQRIFASDLVPDPDLFAYAIEEIRQADPKLLKPMWASLTSQDFRSLLTGLDVPLHMAFGAQSQLYGSEVVDWHKSHVPNVNIRVFEKSGHAPQLEEQDAFNDWLARILTGST